MLRKLKDVVAFEDSVGQEYRELSLTVLNTEGETAQELTERSQYRSQGAKSTFYNSTAIHISGYHKPISKPVSIIVQ